MKSLVAFLAALALSTAHAADLAAVNGSKGGIVGAIKGTLDSPLETTQYLPGYGLSIALRGFEGTPDEVVGKVRPLLMVLAATVRGLNPNDWVSVAFKGDDFEVIVRVRPFDLTMIEVWVDGVQR